MNPDDYRLSKKTSARARLYENNLGFREILAGRLTETTKAVARVGFRTRKYSIFCEGCNRWNHLMESRDFPPEWTCECGRHYLMEYAVYQADHELLPPEQEALNP
jgi:hypothetical protein